MDGENGVVEVVLLYFGFVGVVYVFFFSFVRIGNLFIFIFCKSFLVCSYMLVLVRFTVRIKFNALIFCVILVELFFVLVCLFFFWNRWERCVLWVFFGLFGDMNVCKFLMELMFGIFGIWIEDAFIFTLGGKCGSLIFVMLDKFFIVVIVMLDGSIDLFGDVMLIFWYVFLGVEVVFNIGDVVINGVFVVVFLKFLKILLILNGFLFVYFVGVGMFEYGDVKMLVLMLLGGFEVLFFDVLNMFARMFEIGFETRRFVLERDVFEDFFCLFILILLCWDGVM